MKYPRRPFREVPDTQQKLNRQLDRLALLVVLASISIVLASPRSNRYPAQVITESMGTGVALPILHSADIASPQREIFPFEVADETSSSLLTTELQEDDGLPRQHIEVERSFLERALENTEELYNSIVLEPQYAGADFAGFLLTVRRTDGIYYRLGLDTYDIISHIDGVPANQVADATTLPQYLIHNRQLRLTVTRKGVTRNVEYRLID